MASAIEVPCRRATLGVLTDSWASTTIIFGRLAGKVQHTALNNRLVYLATQGLAESRPSESEEHCRGLEWRRRMDGGWSDCACKAAPIKCAASGGPAPKEWRVW